MEEAILKKSLLGSFRTTLSSKLTSAPLMSAKTSLSIPTLVGPAGPAHVPSPSPFPTWPLLGRLKYGHQASSVSCAHCCWGLWRKDREEVSLTTHTWSVLVCRPPGMGVLAAGGAQHSQPFVAAGFAGWLAANEGAAQIHMGSLRPGAGRKCLCQM